MFIGNQIIDCGGLDLSNTATTQSVTGLFTKLSQALNKDVCIIFKDCVYGVDHKKASAFNVMVYKASYDSIIAIVGTIKITVSDEDFVVIGSID